MRLFIIKLSVNPHPPPATPPAPPTRRYPHNYPDPTQDLTQRAHALYEYSYGYFYTVYYAVPGYTAPGKQRGEGGAWNKIKAGESFPPGFYLVCLSSSPLCGVSPRRASLFSADVPMTAVL